MKLRKLISLFATAAIVMSSAAAMTVPTASAATNGTAFTEDFERMELTSTAGAKATMDTLISDGWYPVDNNKAYTNADTSQSIYQFATVMGDDSNHYLRIITPGQKASNYKLGLGRLFPGQGTNVRGIWEINFKFKPYATGATKAQFNFGLNTYGANVDETVAQHNIISAYNNKMYLGYRDYISLYDGAGVPQGRIDGAGLALDWYDVKVLLNCDARYYSVKLSRGGSLVARRSAISFAGDETIGFFKMSALGMGSPAAVYVDDISIAPASRETLIYNEDFEAFQNVAETADGMTTGGENEDVSGHSFFEGFTPWRAYSGAKSYGLEIDPDLGSQVVRLGDDTETSGTTEASGLVYMIAYEKLVDSATQSKRGMVKTSFKIKPSLISSAGASVNVIADHTEDIAASSAAVFKLVNNSGTPAVLTLNNVPVDLDASSWYDVDLIFDVINHTVTTVVKDDATSEGVASFTYERNTLTAVKGIMFKVAGGSSVLMDDIVIEYCTGSATVDIIGTLPTETGFMFVTEASVTGTPDITEFGTVVLPLWLYTNNQTETQETLSYSTSISDGMTYGVEIANIPEGSEETSIVARSYIIADGTTYWTSPFFASKNDGTLRAVEGGE